MNKFKLVSIGLLVTGLYAPLCLNAGDAVDLSKPALPEGLVKIDNVRGDVSIVGWDKDEISVVGELDDVAKKLIFEVDGGRTLIKVEMPDGSLNWGDGSEIEIRVPKGSRVDFIGVSADIVAEDILGGIRINSVSGDIVANNLKGYLMLNSVSGDIEVENSAGKLRSASVSGNVEVLSHTGQLDLETVSGEVEIKIIENDKLRIKSISGEIEVVSDLLPGGVIDIETLSGEIKLALQGDIDAKFDIDGGMSGDIENDLTADQVSNTRSGQKTLKMQLGDGSGEIRIRTVSANIRIE